MKKQIWTHDERHIGRLILGADEVGVGALAGPIVASAVVLRAGTHIVGVRDSKKMTESGREFCVSAVQEEAMCWYTGWSDSEVVDSLGMHQARLQVMGYCVEHVFRMLRTRTKEEPLIVVDGDQRLPISLEHIALIGGDDKSIAVAAASIIAKVTRDRHMRKLHLDFPQYDWGANKGYGTPKHLAALDWSGINEHHRRNLARRTLRRYQAKKESAS